VGHVASTKAKIIQNIGHRPLEKKSHLEDVSVKIRLKNNIKICLRQMGSEVGQCSPRSFTNQRRVSVNTVRTDKWHKTESTYSLTS
jgi:hypothetical protein